MAKADNLFSVQQAYLSASKPTSMATRQALWFGGLFLLSAALFFSSPAPAQEKELSKKEKKELQRQAIEQRVTAKTFKIQTQQAYTSRGKQVNISSGYGMSVSPEQVLADLPYFGESYGGTAYGGSGGVKLNAKEFDYQMKDGKKGGWEITITPKDDNKDIRTVSLSISADGYVSMNFTFNNRSMMRYAGVIAMEEKK